MGGLSSRGGGGDPLGGARRVANDVLLEHFASDRLDRGEFERRMEALRGAGTAADIRATLRGLPGREPESEALPPGPIATRGTSPPDTSPGEGEDGEEAGLQRNGSPLGRLAAMVRRLFVGLGRGRS